MATQVLLDAEEELRTEGGGEGFGMMCSIEELGSTRDMYPEAPEEGIYIFQEDVPVGADAVEILGLHDVVFE